eukprot:gnl/TRDRNA2_/TRDRNA2_130621_c1_seq1.p1 gnl/TRDRNA2_/TRDRNA2_130621_c1~~gnl/TRDRNA2_/TRDRNA2_130621_c1_seq1.p1  ORF type:complete len:898 (-),score=206.43 gnl/TRDRNA2_/TRDRNA2_130621_c1_seq1:565-3258(-)
MSPIEEVLAPAAEEEQQQRQAQEQQLEEQQQQQEEIDQQQGQQEQEQESQSKQEQAEPQVEPPSDTQADSEAQSKAQEALHCASTLARGGDPDEAIALLRCECVGANPAALGAAYHAVVEAYLGQGRMDPAFDVLTEARHLGSRCSMTAASQELVLKALVQAQYHSRAAELVRTMCGSGAVPGDAVLNSVLDAAVRARAYGEAWDVLELLLRHSRRADKYFVSILTKSLESSTDRRWVRRGIALVDMFIEQQREDVDEIVFNSLLNVLGTIGDMTKLQQTLMKMHEHGVPPSAVTYGTVVKAYGRARDIDAVLKVWAEMRTRCLGVNPVTCGCVLDACVKCGHLDKAMTIFQEMRLQGLHKNTVLYATLIKGLAKVRDLVGTMHLYQEMRTEGVPCNLVTYNSLMDVCVRCGDLQAAAFFLQDMMQIGIDPDLITFSTLIKGYSHTGEVNKALALSRELKSRGLKCDEIMYNSLIDGCAKAGKLSEGLMVFEDMLQARVAPSNITFSILVKLHFEAGQPDGAFRLVDEMAGRHRCAPNRVVYTVLLRCCAQHGGTALHRGVQLLTELASRRNSKMPDQGMVGAVVSGCVQHGDLETAVRVVREFAGGGARKGPSLVPQDCVRLLLEALGARGDARGEELLDYLRKKPLPNVHWSQLQAALHEGRRNPAATGTADLAYTAPQASAATPVPPPLSPMSPTAPTSMLGSAGFGGAPAAPQPPYDPYAVYPPWAYPPVMPATAYPPVDPYAGFMPPPPMAPVYGYNPAIGAQFPGTAPPYDPSGFMAAAQAAAAAAAAGFPPMPPSLPGSLPPSPTNAASLQDFRRTPAAPVANVPAPTAMPAGQVFPPQAQAPAPAPAPQRQRPWSWWQAPVPPPWSPPQAPTSPPQAPTSPPSAPTSPP